MSTRLDRREGFSLVELLVAVAVGSVVLSALVVATSFASRRQVTIARDNIMVGQEVLSVEALRASLRSASFLVAPAAGAQTEHLAGYVNADESAGFAPILPGRPQSYFYFCLEQGPPLRLYRYAGALGPPPNRIPAITCGQPGGESLAGTDRLTPSFRFTRPLDHGNIITIDYSLTYAPGGSAPPQVRRGQTAVQTQVPL